MKSKEKPLFQLNGAKSTTPPKTEGLELGQVVTRAELLGLTPEDEAIVNIRLALYRKLKEARARSGLSQSALAERIGSSQSRIAKAEAGSGEISLDLILRAAIASGADAREIGEAITATQTKATV